MSKRHSKLQTLAIKFASSYRIFAACMVLCLTLSGASAQIPTTIEVPLPSEWIRAQLPKDGELQAQGEISKNYFAFALGHRVNCEGTRVFVADPLSKKGIIFRDGMIEVNAGFHAEREEQVLVFEPTFAVNGVINLQLTVDDHLNVGVAVLGLEIQGDNAGGELAERFAKDRLLQAFQEEARKLGSKLSNEIQSKLPQGKLRIEITPKSLIARPNQSIPLKVMVHSALTGDQFGESGKFVGSRGAGRQVEGFQIDFAEPVPGLGLEYGAHVAFQGDLPQVSHGTFVGTRGESRRMEGFWIKLTGEEASKYDVEYRAHLAGIGETRFFRNGEFCGTRGEKRQIEGIQVRITKK